MAGLKQRIQKAGITPAQSERVRSKVQKANKYRKDVSQMTKKRKGRPSTSSTPMSRPNPLKPVRPPQPVPTTIVAHPTPTILTRPLPMVKNPLI